MNLNLIFVAVLFATVNSQIHYNALLNTRSCLTGEPSPASTLLFFNPCYDTPGCVLPNCCGVIGGQVMNFTIIYTATMNARGGVIRGYANGLSLTKADSDPIRLLVPIEVPRVVWEKVLLVNMNICYNAETGQYYDPVVPDFCPQTPGNVYTVKENITFPPVVNTATVVLEFQSAINDGPNGSGNELLCIRFWARIVAPYLIPYALLNSIPLLG